jgi:hypothetical protein
MVSNDIQCLQAEQAGTRGLAEFTACWTAWQSHAVGQRLALPAELSLITI